MLPFALFLALVWGAAWAVFLQLTPLGKFLARQRTWLTVVTGVGVDLLIALAVVPWPAWLTFISIIAVSSLPIILRSLINERRELIEVLDAAKNPAGQQDHLGH